MLGPGYALINPKLRSVKKTRIKAGKNKLEKIERVFVFMGGTDPRNFTEKVVEQLLYSPLKDCVIDVVLGKENTYKTELKQRFSENDNVVFHVQPNYYFELMEKADLAIGSNGVAQLERLYINLPSVVIPIAANQEPIYNDLIKAQAILPWDFLLEEDSKIELNQIPITVFTIANIIQAKPLVLRKVTVEDAQDIYNWRIHSSVSSVSKSSSFFSYEDHLIWINQKLQQENCLFLICELENKSKLGVVRFDINDQDAFISIFLNPSYQRLGYGKKFLKKALDFFKKENHPCNRIIAEVLVANIASKKLFSNVGFKQEKNTYILKFRSNL